MGIDLERFPDINPELICSICAGVLEEPVECPCRHVFCTECISRWLNTKQSCPNCRNKVRARDLKPALPLLRNIINKSKIRCDFAQNGCAELVELERLGAHTSVCPFAPMTCENQGCDITFLRRYKAEHEAECPKRKIRCESALACLQGGCGMELYIADFPGHNCVQSLRTRVQELEQQLSDQAQRMSALEETVKKLQQADQKKTYSSRAHTLTSGLLDVDSGLISLVSDDQDSDSSSNSFNYHNILDPRYTDLDVTNALITGRFPHRGRDREQRRTRQQSPRRERSRSRSPLRQDESENSGSRRNRERSPCGSTSLNRCGPGHLSPFDVSSSPSTSHTHDSGDLSVVPSTSRRNAPEIIENSSSVQSSPVVIQHIDSESELDFEDDVPPAVVRFTPSFNPHDTIVRIGDRIHQWLQSSAGSCSDSGSSFSSSC